MDTKIWSAWSFSISGDRRSRVADVIYRIYLQILSTQERDIDWTAIDTHRHPIECQAHGRHLRRGLEPKNGVYCIEKPTAETRRGWFARLYVIHLEWAAPCICHDTGEPVSDASARGPTTSEPNPNDSSSI